MNRHEIELVQNMNQVVTELLQGNCPAQLSPADYQHLQQEELRTFVDTINQLVRTVNDASTFINALARGALRIEPPARNFLISPFKQLHANLRHLIWQIQQIAKGDLSQHVDFLTDFSEAFNTMIDSLREKEQIKDELRQAHEKLALRAQQLADSNSQLHTEIARREDMMEKLQETKDAIDSANHAKSEFLAHMSHELRTPLNAIIGFSELLLDKDFGPLNSTQEEWLADIHTSSNHLLSLINDILDLSKVESGKMKLEFSEVNLEMLLKCSLIMIKERALKQNIHIKTDLIDLPDTMFADERKVKQILYNLLSNAIKFTPYGGQIVLTAKRKSTPAGDCVEIAVTDTGIGLKHSDLERIFAPFEQIQHAGPCPFQGTGLGLSLTKRLVEMHQGTIWAESAGEGQGTTFTVRLPIQPKNIGSAHVNGQ